MIKSFKSKETEQIWLTHSCRRFPADIQNRALTKLNLLDTAATLEDLRIFPGNGIETLSGDRKDQVSIRVNNQWRICFIWNEGEVEQVEITDYH